MKTMSRVSWGYGLGSMMRVGENLFGFYLIYYLTTVAGISPALAGAIGGAGLLIGALASPVIGYLSDRSRSRYGRRRPFMLATVIPSMVLLTVLFTRVDFGSATGTFYFVIAIAFALTYYGFLVPYDALGASLSNDYDHRTAIRSICTALLYVSVLVGGTLVLQVQGALMAFMPDAAAWTLAVLLTCSIPGALFGLLAWRTTRGAENHDEDSALAAEVERSVSIRAALRIFTIRPVWSILIWGFIYFFANAIMAGSLIYLGVFVLGLPEAVASTYFLVSTVTTLIAIIPGNLLAKAIGKRNAIFVAMAIFAIGALTMFVVGFNGYGSGLVITVAFGICNSVVLSCSYAMIYDLREVTELRLGGDRTAVILGWFSLVIGASGSLAAITIGTVLQGAGFDPTAAPTAAATAAIIALQTWIPAGLLVVSAIALALWNINARSHAVATEEIITRRTATIPTVK